MNSDILRNRAKTVRDIRIFALHLNNETKGQATLALLPNVIYFAYIFLLFVLINLILFISYIGFTTNITLH